MNEIRNDEFQRWMNLLKADIQGVQDRLDALNGRTRTAELKLAVLEDRGHPGAWGGGIGALIVGLVEAVRWFTK